MKSNFVTLGNFVEEIKQRIGTEKKTVYSVTNNRGFIPSSEVFDKQVFSADISNYKLVEYNDLAYNPSRINVGSVAICPDTNGGAVSPMYTIARCKKELLPQYLLYFLRSEKGISEINHRSEGAVRFQFKFKDLQRTPIYLPSITEQERIVRLLDEAKSLQATRERANVRMEQFVPALFQEMFGSEKFPDTKLSDLCHFITKGTTPKSQDIKDKVTENDDVPFLKVYHITDDGGIDFHYNPSFVSGSIHNGFLKRSIVYPNDVLMNIVGPPLGKIGIVPSEYSEWNINQAIAIFRAKEKVEPLYLLHALRHKPILNKLLRQAVGIRQYNLSLEQCRNFMIPLPPLALQQEFAERVKEAREIQSAQGRSTERVEALYQSMLDRAFKGEL